MFAGLNPLVAVTGEGGLKKALEFRPDLILLELDLTDMNGLKFVSLLREKPQLQTVPIVAMSIFPHLKNAALYRSEERRVGKECRYRWSPYH